MILTSSVTTNSSSAISTSADANRSLGASANWLAIVLATVSDAPSSDAPIRRPLPITIVTAIVSPSARPRARMHAPMNPDFAAGQTAMRIISQRVAPSPSAASRYVAGTERTASSETDTIIGSTMIARINTAQSMFRGSIGSRKNGVQPNSLVSTGTLWFITNGASTKTPHSPYTTLGTVARISITNRTIPL